MSYELFDRLIFQDHLLVRVVDQKGGIFTIATPHGTRIELGLVYMARDTKPMTEAQCEILKQLETDCIRNDIPLYVGKKDEEKVL